MSARPARRFRLVPREEPRPSCGAYRSTGWRAVASRCHSRAVSERSALVFDLDDFAMMRQTVSERCCLWHRQRRSATRQRPESTPTALHACSNKTEREASHPDGRACQVSHHGINSTVRDERRQSAHTGIREGLNGQLTSSHEATKRHEDCRSNFQGCDLV